ncbi:MAG: NAD-dependent epimerase/dehydratase family protein [Methanomicrobiales archaeon]|nr:NAD-dependent epimerase/dehydratase family protein [Methanomicrobiales archaeon]
MKQDERGSCSILVTGSSGTIGTRLCERLMDDGHVVAGVDLQRNPWNADVEAITVRGELRDPSLKQLEKLPFIPDLVVHLAAHARVYELVKDPARAQENVALTFNILEYCRRKGIRKLIFASSREVYGNSSTIVHKEEDVRITGCESPYSASKVAGEAMAHAYWGCYGIEPVILRFSNVYGCYDSSDRVIPLFIRKTLANKPLTVYGKDKILDFTYIDDAVSGINLTIDRFEHVAGDTFNIASGQGTQLLDIARMIQDALGGTNEIFTEDNRPGEVVRYIADISKARRLLHYNPKVPIEKGLAVAVEWYSQYASRAKSKKEPA